MKEIQPIGAFMLVVLGIFLIYRGLVDNNTPVFLIGAWFIYVSKR